MRPRVIVHNSVSVDGAFTGFEIDLGRHYQAAGMLGGEARLVGSATARTGFDTFGVPEERAVDRKRPDKGPELPWWALIDTGGRCEGLLHGLRGFEACRDVIVFVSERTPPSYLAYLRDRDYRWHVCGPEKADTGRVLEVLAGEYDVRTVVTDTGAGLVGVLMDRRQVDEISLLVHPTVVGGAGPGLFSGMAEPAMLTLQSHEALGDGIVQVRYGVDAGVGA